MKYEINSIHVLPWSHFNTAGGKGSRDAASSKLLQEKLSHYLDIVEVNIAHQISLRSEAFFSCNDLST